MYVYIYMYIIYNNLYIYICIYILESETNFILILLNSFLIKSKTIEQFT